MIRRGLSRDDGSALIIALIFTGVWSIVILAIVGFATTGFTVASGTADQRDETYAAAGATQSAIAATRVYLDNEGDPGDCPSLRFVHVEEVDGEDVVIDDITVVVDCATLRLTERWEPYQDWVWEQPSPSCTLFDPGTRWLDNPVDGLPGECDPTDIEVRNGPGIGQYGDVNGNGVYDAGIDPTHRQRVEPGDVTLTAEACEPDTSCSPVLVTHVRFDSDSASGDTAVIERWRVLR